MARSPTRAREAKKSVMRTCEYLRSLAYVAVGATALTVWAAPASALDPATIQGQDGSRPLTSQDIILPPGAAARGAAAMAPALAAPGAAALPLLNRALPPPAATPADQQALHGGEVDPFAVGTRLYYLGKKDEAAEQLRRAAEAGHPIAMWKLGRMYETGDGVPEDHAKAFEYFSQVARGQFEEGGAGRHAPPPFMASAFTAIGSYYLSGIDNSIVKPNAEKAREVFTYAASYFGDPEAQYQLGRLYLATEEGAKRDPRQAARWLYEAAKKNHIAAQAELGQLLFVGDELVPRRVVQGLMWLTVARQRIDEVKDDWIRDAQEQAFSIASDGERRQAVKLAQDWIARNGR